MSIAVSVAAWRAGWLTVVVCVGFAAAGAAQVRPPETGAALQIVAGANGSALDAAVVRATAADLAAKSPTSRQMLAAVGNAERRLGDSACRIDAGSAKGDSWSTTA